MIKKYLYLCFFAFIFSLQATIPFLSNLSSYLPSYEDRWNWETIDLSKILPFPCNFIWGTADSALQTEGIVTSFGKQIENSWTVWEKGIITKNGILQPRFAPDKRAGFSCERWSRYKDDITLAQKIGMNAHRFSIDWSKIEPENGIFDKNAMDHYIDYARTLIEHGLQPIPTLFHHAWPLWFEYTDHAKYMGSNARKPAFEDARNIEDFVEFAVYVFTAFKNAGLLNDVKLWLTFNEPVGYAMAAYIDGKLPPGKKYEINVCGIVVKNILDAHIAVYEAFKKIDPTVKISFAHMMNPIQPYHPWNPLDYIPAKIADYLMNDVALEYFKTGKFTWLTSVSLQDFTPYNAWRKIKSFNFPNVAYTHQYNPHALGKLDFIGVNYYSHTLLKLFKLAARPNEKLADNYEVPMIKALYPEGFYEVLKKASTLGIPIIVTENGFAATDALREEYLKKHLYVLQKAMNDGMDIRGYLFWTLTDCFGWNSGHHSRHGIYAVDFETQERTFRKGAQYFVDVVNASKSSTYYCLPLS